MVRLAARGLRLMTADVLTTPSLRTREVLSSKKPWRLWLDLLSPCGQPPSPKEGTSFLVTLWWSYTHGVPWEPIGLSPLDERLVVIQDEHDAAPLEPPARRKPSCSSNPFEDENPAWERLGRVGDPWREAGSSRQRWRTRASERGVGVAGPANSRLNLLPGYSCGIVITTTCLRHEMGRLGWNGAPERRPVRP